MVPSSKSNYFLDEALSYFCLVSSLSSMLLLRVVEHRHKNSVSLVLIIYDITEIMNMGSGVLLPIFNLQFLS